MTFATSPIRNVPDRAYLRRMFKNDDISPTHFCRLTLRPGKTSTNLMAHDTLFKLLVIGLGLIPVALVFFQTLIR